MTGKRTLPAAVAITTLAAAGLVGATTSNARQYTRAVRGRQGRGADTNRPLPIGVLTFLMTDVAGSTRMREERPDIAGGVLERHEAVIRTVVHERGGVLIRSKGEGDSTFSVFADACGSVISGSRDPTGAPARAMARRRGSSCARRELHRRRRAARGATTAGRRRTGARGSAPQRIPAKRCARNQPKPGCQASRPEILRIDLGLYRLRDVACPERVFQVGHRELRAEFPPLRTPAVDGACCETACELGRWARSGTRRPFITAIADQRQTARAMRPCGVRGAVNEACTVILAVAALALAGCANGNGGGETSAPRDEASRSNSMLPDTMSTTTSSAARPSTTTTSSAPEPSTTSVHAGAAGQPHRAAGRRARRRVPPRPRRLGTSTEEMRVLILHERPRRMSSGSRRSVTTRAGRLVADAIDDRVRRRHGARRQPDVRGPRC